MKISRQAHDDLIGAVEDAIAFSLNESRKNYGELVSGECAANVVLCHFIAEVAELEGVVEPRTPKN